MGDQHLDQLEGLQDFPPLLLRRLQLFGHVFDCRLTVLLDPGLDGEVDEVGLGGETEFVGSRLVQGDFVVGFGEFVFAGEPTAATTCAFECQ